MTDIRIDSSFANHPKRRKLQRRCGADGVLAFVDLLLWVAQDACRSVTGDLSGLDDEDIEIASSWAGKPGELIKALVEVRLVDGEEGSRKVHNWHVRQPFLAEAPKRQKASQLAASARWDARNRTAVGDATRSSNASSDDAPAMRPACDSDADSMRPACDSDADLRNRNAPSDRPTDRPTKEEEKNSGRLPAQSLLSPAKSTDPHKEALDQLCARWLAHFPAGAKRIGKSYRAHLRARLVGGYTEEQLGKCLDYIAKSEWHHEKGQVRFELACRSDEQVEKCLAALERGAATKTVETPADVKAMYAAVNEKLSDGAIGYDGARELIRLGVGLAAVQTLRRPASGETRTLEDLFEILTANKTNGDEHAAGSAAAQAAL